MYTTILYCFSFVSIFLSLEMGSECCLLCTVYSSCDLTGKVNSAEQREHILIEVFACSRYLTS